MASRKYAKSLDIDLQYISISTLRKGDVSEKVVIHDSEKDIQRWNAVSIYEDIFKNFMTCEIVLVDQDGMFLNRFRTEEVIVIRFCTPDLEKRTFQPRDHYFYLYKIDPVMILNKPNGAVYSIRGISFEFFYNSLRTFSKGYSGRTEVIAEEIYKEFLDAKSERTIRKKFRVGRPTKNEMKFTFPYVNPLDAINHLASVSIDSANPDICNYVFYEDKDGFNFKSITEIIENPRKIHKYITSKTSSTPFANFGAYFDNTITVTPIRGADKIVDTLDGVYGEFFADYDLMYKSYKPYIFIERGRGGNVHGKRYLEYFPKTKHLNEKPLLSKENEIFTDPIGRNRICFSNKALYSEKKKLENGQETWQLYQTHEEEYSFQRRSMMQQINSMSVELVVPGNSDITVGDLIDLDTVIYRSSDPDLYLSGKYLVTAVHHAINLDGYKSIITISRDSIKSNEFDDNSEPGE